MAKERQKVNPFQFVLICNQEQGNFIQDDACYSHILDPRVRRF